jgi:wyosine [tRNA(Phe)-imidazoG37] synthetase (radical SAM superfamily)
MSLGVDLVPRKVCTLNCIYCECGETTKLTVDREPYIPYQKIISELDSYFSGSPDPDYITFSGSGEPTLNSNLGRIIEYIRETKPGIPVAVLTNGTLLHDKAVRDEISKADLVLPSLDSAAEGSFQRINRPHPSLDVAKYIRGLKDFREQYTGQIWLEVFILPGVNDSRTDLDLLKGAFLEIRPDRIQLNTLDRPGIEVDIEPATHQQLSDIAGYWNMEEVEIIASAAQRKEQKSYRTDIREAILETIDRRPCTLDDMLSILGLHAAEVNKYLDVLEAEGAITHVRQGRGVFYRLKG